MHRWLGIWGLLIATQLSAGYLPKVGPPPLRFQSPPRTTLAPTPRVLPPLASSESAATGPTTNWAATITNSTVVLTEVVTPPTRAPNAIPDPSVATIPSSSPLDSVGSGFPATGLTVAFASETNTTPVITPQMLIPFFATRSGTNNNAATFVLPLGFAPPAPAAAPSSSATYSSPPAGGKN